MAIFLAFFAIVLIVSGVRGTERDLLAQVGDDGKHFVPWLFVLVAVGAVGFSKTWRPVSSAFMVLIVIAMVLRSYSTIISGFNQILNESKT